MEREDCDEIVRIGEGINWTEHEDEFCLKDEELKMRMDQANFQVSLLEDQLRDANGEIKFLRKEISSSQLDLLSSRSEVKILLDELKTYKSGKEFTEQFPDLLLSSLDKLYEDKQQQLWLINVIQNSIDKSKPNKCPLYDSIRNGHDAIIACDKYDKSIEKENKEKVVDQCGSQNKMLNQEEMGIVPNLATLVLESENVAKRSHPPLTLELKKAYEFSPTSMSWNNRSLHTPSSNFLPPFQSWTPSTPTPVSALRPSLSLHNLASKTFTEVLVPSIRPPDTHQVTPTSSASPRSPNVLTLSPSSKGRGIVNLHQNLKTSPSPQHFKKTTSPPNLRHYKSKPSAYSSPKPIKISRKKCSPVSQPTPKTPSPPCKTKRSFTSLSRLSEISENKIFMECSKEISV